VKLEKGDKIKVVHQKYYREFGFETIQVADVDVWHNGIIIGAGEITMDSKGRTQIPPLRDLGGQYLEAGWYDLSIVSDWRLQVRAKRIQ
jgi:hypothetical protein